MKPPQISTLVVKDAIAADINSFGQIECPCCGMEVLSADGHSGFCHFCEYPANTNYVQNAPDTVQKSDFTAALKKSDLPTAQKALEKMLAANKPEIFYLAGNFYRYFSDAIYLDVNYASEGFMEENSEHRTNSKFEFNSMHLTSKSREYFYKLLKITNGEKEDQSIIFLRFMSCIRLKKYAEAEWELNGLRTLSRDAALVSYAFTVFSACTKKAPDTAHIIPLLQSKTVNAYYYLAKMLINQRQFSYAEDLLKKINKSAIMPNAIYESFVLKGLREASGL
jgi:uncharacterized Zn finger protein (UPF0148 family)